VNQERYSLRFWPESEPSQQETDQANAEMEKQGYRLHSIGHMEPIAQDELMPKAPLGYALAYEKRPPTAEEQLEEVMVAGNALAKTADMLYRNSFVDNSDHARLAQAIAAWRAAVKTEEGDDVE